MDEITKFIFWFIKHTSYYALTGVKDLIVFLAGGFVGEIVMALLFAKFYMKVNKVEHLERMTIVRMKHEGKSHYFTNPKTYVQTVETILIIMLMPIIKPFSKRDYTIEDEKRARRLVIIMCLIGTIVLILSIILIDIHVLPDGHVHRRFL